jgi:hypothetical protein
MRADVAFNFENRDGLRGACSAIAMVLSHGDEVLNLARASPSLPTQMPCTNRAD